MGNQVPDWAVDVRYRHKSFVFTDGKRKTQFLDGGRCDSTKVKNWVVVHKIIKSRHSRLLHTIKPNPMGNNQIKKRAAEEHNKKRREEHVERVRIAQDKIDNPEKYNRNGRGSRKGVSKAQAVITAALALSADGFDSRHRKSAASPTFAVPYGKQKQTEPKLIKNWEELSKVVTCSKGYYLDIVPEDGNGWIRDSKGNHVEYMTTHTFYSKNYKFSTKLLQEHGFNVVLENWDK